MSPFVYQDLIDLVTYFSIGRISSVFIDVTMWEQPKGVHVV